MVEDGLGFLEEVGVPLGFVEDVGEVIFPVDNELGQRLDRAFKVGSGEPAKGETGQVKGI